MQQAIRPWGWCVDTFYNWWRVKKLGMSRLCSHIASYIVSKSETNVQVLRTHTDILSIHLGGVDNHKDLLNGAGCSSLYQVLLYRAHDRWDCHDGWRCRSRGGYNILDQIETAEWAQAPGRPGLPPCLMNPPKLEGGDEWLSGFLLKAMNKSGRAKVWETRKDALYQHARRRCPTKLQTS